MTNQLQRIAICGATGKQGGAVISALQQYDNVNIVGITRDATSEQALKLIEQGVEVVEANYDDINSLRVALRGCHSVFVVTNFWEHLDAKREYRQACAIFDAAESENVQHVVWSTLEYTMDSKYKDGIPIVNNYKVAHFDEKGLANNYAKTKQFNLTSLYTSFYYENLTGMMKIQPDENGNRTLCLPMDNKLLPVTGCEDIGNMASYCLINKIYGDVGVACEHLTGEQMATILSASTGEAFVYSSVPANVYRTFGFPGCQEIGNMFEFKNVHNDDFCERRSIQKVKTMIDPTLFSTWCSQHKEELI